MPNLIVSKEEWKIAHDYLDEQVDGTKLPYTAKVLSPYLTVLRSQKYWPCYWRYQTYHSFIKINGIIYALAPGKSSDAIAGQGGNGKVKYAVDEQNTYHVLKIQKGLKKHYLNEFNIMASLNLSQGISFNVQNGKSYIHMAYKGEQNLYSFIPQIKTDEERFQLAIDVCLIVDRLHRGLDDKNRIGYAHLDIKPANITRDEQGNCHLVDFGCAEKYPDKTLEKTWGTEVYRPSSGHIKLRTGMQYDMLALKRTLFIPEKFLWWQGVVMVTPNSGLFGVLDKNLLDKYQLTPYLDTSDPMTYFKHDDHTTASTLAAILISACLKLPFDVPSLIEAPWLCLAISDVFFVQFSILL